MTTDERAAGARVPPPPAHDVLAELVEEFCGWWELNREGSVNRTYDYLDKLTKRLRAAVVAAQEPEK